MDMDRSYKDKFVEYLQREKRMSANTLDAYSRDVQEFITFEGVRGNADILAVTGTEIVAFLHRLKAEGKSSSTTNRKLASIRSFYNYLISEGLITDNPTVNIKSPKIERKEIDYLQVEEIEKLLDAPDDSYKGIRDRAILEVLYATGLRVTEIIEADVIDINLRMGFITCDGDMARARIVPLGRPARKALEEYLVNGRDALVRDNTEEEALFVNVQGKRITRQGIWKMLKEYGKIAGIEKKLTPNIIRNSFAVHMLQNGADLKSLQEMMGHEDISATQVYLSATKSRIKDVYDKAHPRA
ncbi:MAG: tyrosine recombinase XerD [Eubacterium sp.]|nr:tyrosine recombinase XerD [Candidatus Colimonas fimequi]